MYLTLYAFRDWLDHKRISILQRNGAQISPKSKSRLKIRGPRMVTLASYLQILGASSKSGRRCELAPWFFHTPTIMKGSFSRKIPSIDEIKFFCTNLVSLCTVQCTQWCQLQVVTAHILGTGWAVFPQDSYSRLAPKVTRRSHLLLLLFYTHTSRFDCDYHYGDTLSDVTSFCTKTILYLCMKGLHS